MKFLKIILLMFFTVLLFPFSLIITPVVLIIISLKSYDNIAVDKKEYFDYFENNRLNNNQIPENISTKLASQKIYFDSSPTNSQEELVSYFLNMLDVDKYTVINNVTIPSSGNTTNTQIDHVVVSRYGIFCIETKSHKGWIFGSDKQKNWTQVLYKEHYPLYNPLKQNFAHVQALKSLLGLNLKRPIIPIVVFTNADRLKVTGEGNVGDIMYMIEKIKKSKILVYDQFECERIVNSIKYSNKTDFYTRNRHQAEVKDLIAISKA